MMSKSLIAAAAFGLVALGSAGSASAAVGGGLGGVRAAAPELAQQVHWRPYKHSHYKKWRKHKRKYVCVGRPGHRRCWWR